MGKFLKNCCKKGAVDFYEEHRATILLVAAILGGLLIAGVIVYIVLKAMNRNEAGEEDIFEDDDIREEVDEEDFFENDEE